MFKGNADRVIIYETKVTGVIYVRDLSGYLVTAMEAPIRHRGGVVVFRFKAGK